VVPRLTETTLILPCAMRNRNVPAAMDPWRRALSQIDECVAVTGISDVAGSSI
jgi:hypothetical protein